MRIDRWTRAALPLVGRVVLSALALATVLLGVYQAPLTAWLQLK